MRAALYIRVSTEEQAEHGYSLDAQKKRLIEYCNQKNYEIYKLYADEGISGASIEKRVSLIEMIKDAEQKKFDVVVVYKTDRLGRSTIDLLTIQKKLFSCGVNLEMSDEGFDVNDDAGMAMFSITAVFSEYEHKKIAGRTMTGKRQAILTSKNKLKTNITPYGYQYDPLTKVFAAEYDKVGIINDIYDLYIDGKSFRQIAKEMIRRNIPYRNRYDWSNEMVSRIIRNPVYKGYTGISYYSSVKRGVKLKNEPIIVKANNVEPIVSEEKWDKANSISSSRVFLPRKFCKSLFIFGDVAYCSKCGYKLTYTQSTVTNSKGAKVVYRYYNCSSISHHYEPGYLCEGWRRDYKKVNQMFIDYIKGFKLSSKISDKNSQKQIDELKKKIDSLDSTIKRKKIQREVLLDKLTSNVISDDDYKLMSNKIVQEIESSQSQINELTEQLNNMSDIAAFNNNLSSKINELKSLVKVWNLLSDEKKRFIVNSCIKKIYIYKDEITQIEFK